MREATTADWLFGAGAVGCLICAIVYLVAPRGHKLGIALDATARWSFLWFWLASSGRALAGIFGARFAFSWIARRVRDFGLAFATAHLVHLALVARLLYISPTPFYRPALFFFGTAALCIYLLVLLSFRPFSTLLKHRTVRVGRWVAVEYISLAFIVDFAKEPLHGDLLRIAAYLPFLILAVAGPLLRIIAAVRRSIGPPRLATSRLSE